MFCKPAAMSYSYDLTRYENVERSFKIKKAMLSNHRNYRSSYERLFEQVSHLKGIKLPRQLSKLYVYGCILSVLTSVYYSCVPCVFS